MTHRPERGLGLPRPLNPRSLSAPANPYPISLLSRVLPQTHAPTNLTKRLRALLVHLGTVIGLMKVNTDYRAFERQLDQIAQIYPETPGLFDNPADWEEPKD